MTKSPPRVKIPLRLVLILPFILQIFATVGLVGWLSLRNGQNAIAALARELQGEIGQRIEDRLNAYTRIPAIVNRMDANLARTGDLNLDDLQGLQQYFLRQLLVFPDTSYIGWGNERGEFAGAFRDDRDRLALSLKDPSTNGDLVSFRSDRQGQKREELNRIPYDPRGRPWYRAAVVAEEMAWSIPPYPWAEGVLGIDLNLPFYEDEDKKNLKGVFAVSFTLDAIGDFLEGLKIGKSGQAFIIERSGQLIGTSIPEPLARDNGGELAPVFARESSNPVIRETVAYLQAQFGTLSQIQETYRGEIAIARERHFLQVTAFQDDAGLDWLAIVVIPKADFMAEIAANTHQTFWLCLLILGVDIVLGFFTSGWIAKPLLQLDRQLKQASSAMSEGNWERRLPPSNIHELDGLATSFNRMSRKLQGDREQLADYSRILEGQVKARAEALKTSKERFELVSQSVNDGIWDWRIDRDETYFSPQWKAMLGYEDDEITNTFASWEKLVHPEDIPQAKAVLQAHLQGQTETFRAEFRMRCKSGDYRWILSRAKAIERDGEGIPLRLVGSHTDISDRKAAKQALQASEARNRAIVSALPDILSRVSGSGILLDFLPSTTDIKIALPSGVNPIGKHLSELLPAAMARGHIEAIEKALFTGELQVYEQEVVFDDCVQYEEIRVVPSGPDEALVIIKNNSARKRAKLALRREVRKSERLLLNILPRSIADRLKESEGAIAENYESASILFADIAGFTPLASQIAPEDLVRFLDLIFSTFDRLAEEHDLEKIKTIGDAYMVAGGLPDPQPDHLAAIADMALAIQEIMPSLSSETLQEIRQGKPLQVRIGIATGAVVAGVIGQNKFIYDLWGDTVNVASRMESLGEPGAIQVTEDVYLGLRDRYHFRGREIVTVKGKGEMKTYWLIGKKD